MGTQAASTARGDVVGRTPALGFRFTVTRSLLVHRPRRDLVELAEANSKWVAEQATEEHLYTAPSHTQFLQQVAQIAIVPFCF